MVMLSAMLSATGCAQAQDRQEAVVPETPPAADTALPKVYLFKEISSENLVRIYEALGREAKGKVAVKLSTGEPGGHNFLQPALIKELVERVNGTVVECNTAYGGGRSDTESHLKAATDHGFTAIAPVDIMDAEGEVELPVVGGKHLTRDIVGKNYLNYDFTIILSHFKGHAMGGFGGAIKNISIGIASTEGKCLIHTGGKSNTSPWGGDSPTFMDSMAEAGKSVVDALDGNILFISVMNNLSVDCDCTARPSAPDIHDIGILASTDPVALDQACVDLIYQSEGAESMIRRIEGVGGEDTLEHGEEIGLGNRAYKLVVINE